MSRMLNGRATRAEGGFVYIALLIFVAVIAISLSAVSEVWSFSAQRDRETELLFIGNQYRRAITLYYTSSPRGVRAFPHSLEELLVDNRTEDNAQHYLRRLYPDPMTGKVDWGTVTLPDGGIVGVYSRSEGTPIKQAGFSRRDKVFAEQTRYSDWVFRSPLPAANPVLGAGAGYGTKANGPTGAPPQPQAPGPIRSTPGTKPSTLPSLH